VLYNNALSCAFGMVLTSASGELGALAAARREDMSVDTLARISALLLVSCAFGLAISFFGFGFRARVSATTFTVVGVMCKVVSVSASLLLLRSDWTAPGLLGLGLCLVGGACYTQAPMRSRGTDASAELQQLLGGHNQRRRALDEAAGARDDADGRLR
jgi:GDP-mannose transporter